MSTLNGISLVYYRWLGPSQLILSFLFPARVWNAAASVYLIINYCHILAPTLLLKFTHIKRQLPSVPFWYFCVVSYASIFLYRAELHALFFGGQAIKTIIVLCFHCFLCLRCTLTYMRLGFSKQINKQTWLDNKNIKNLWK